MSKKENDLMGKLSSFSEREMLELILRITVENDEEIKERLGRLETDVAELKERVGRLESDVTELKGDVAELKGDVAELNAKYEKISCRLSKVEILIEDVLIPDIKIVAEGHGNLIRRQEETEKSFAKFEALSIRVSALEYDRTIRNLAGNVSEM